MAESSSGGSATEISLSVEETNKLRAKLGLKPLQVDGSGSAAGRVRDDPSNSATVRQRDASSASFSQSAGTDAAVSEAAARRTAEKSLRSGEAADEERRRAARMQRERKEEARRKATHAAFTQGLTIAEQQRLEDEDCDPATWIAHMRRKEAREKLVLASQGKLDVARYDSDEEEADSSPRAAAGRQEWSSTSRREDDNRVEAASGRKRVRGEIGGREEAVEEEAEDEGIGGLHVVHGLKDIQEGEDVVLTLKDARILTAEGDLNEDGDTLESVQLVEKERLQKRLKAKARQTVYDPTAEEEEEETEDGTGKKEKEILKHYDEWEEEQLEAQGKTSRKERATGFVLPHLQQRDTHDVVEVPLHRLRAAGQSVRQQAGGRGQRSGRGEKGEGEGTKCYDPGSSKKSIQYDASGPSSVVLGEEFDARQEEDAEKPVTFRKMSKKKISKKKHGSDFWKDLFGDGLASRSGEEEAEEGEADRSGDDRNTGQRQQRKERHHGSRKDRVEDEAERRSGAQQKQSVRDALERAAETAHKQRGNSSSSSSPHSYSSSRSKEEQRRDSGGAAAGEDSVQTQRRRRASVEFPDGDALPLSWATADVSGEGTGGPPEDEMLLEEDRLLREQLERQRRLARAKLLEQERLKLKASKEDQDEKGQQSLQNEDDEGEDNVQLFRKLPQARLLDLLSRAQRSGAALVDARPTDTASGAESSLRGAGRGSSLQQQNGTGAATALAAGSASVGSLVKKEEEAEEDEGGGLQISTTTEFCRTVQTPLEKLQTMKQEVFAGARLFRQQKAAQTQGRSERSTKVSKAGISEASSVAGSGSRRGRKEENGEEEDLPEAERRGTRRCSRRTGKVSDAGSDAGDDSEEMEIDGEKNSVVGGAENEKQVKADEEEDDDELEDVAFMNEAPMGHGIAETLKYLQSKNHYSLDKMRQRRHRPDELPLHKPVAPNEIKIDHRDMYGNVMTPKDAFRQISWRFHGKYPSLNKQEKQARKMHLERKLLKNPMEALPTLNALQKLQQTEKTFHMVLTGGSLGDGGGNR